MKETFTGEERKFIKRLHRRLTEAITTFGLIDKGDKIILGLSGGKDSLALLHLLGGRMTRSGGYFTIEAAHVRMKGVNYETSTDYLAAEAARYAIPLHILDAEMPIDRNERRTPCYLCARNRRKALFNLAQSIGASKIALGHHRDDLIKTALMNLTFNGSFTTMPARLDFDKMPLSLIRPLALIDESDIVRLSEILQFQQMKHSCPNEDFTSRTQIERVLLEMQTLTPDAKDSIWHALIKTASTDGQI